MLRTHYSSDPQLLARIGTRPSCTRASAPRCVRWFLRSWHCVHVQALWGLVGRFARFDVATVRLFRCVRPVGSYLYDVWMVPASGLTGLALHRWMHWGWGSGMLRRCTSFDSVPIFECLRSSTRMTATTWWASDLTKA